MPSEPETILIVGSGAAGVMTAQALRRRDYGGRIEVIGDEPAHTYDRPPLSKQVLSGAWEPNRAGLLPAERLQSLNVEWRMDHATGLDVDAHLIRTAEAGEIGYDELVIATGVRARTLPWHDGRVHTLRTIGDALKLRGALEGAAGLAVVGGGFLGFEVAATARGHGVEVTVIEPLSEPLANRLTAPVAGRLLDLHREHGVDVRAGTGASGFDGSTVELSDGDRLAADVVLVAIGSDPCVEWLRGSAVELGNGVVCDEYCRAADGVWAAGDVARWHHRGLDQSIRIEHRLHAAEQGAAVAANLLGGAEPFVPIPFFWTDHYDVKIQVWGVVPPGVEPELAEGELDGERFVLVCRQPGGTEIVGAIGWNSPREMPAYRAQIAATWYAKA